MALDHNQIILSLSAHKAGGRCDSCSAVDDIYICICKHGHCPAEVYRRQNTSLVDVPGDSRQRCRWLWSAVVVWLQLRLLLLSSTRLLDSSCVVVVGWLLFGGGGCGTHISHLERAPGYKGVLRPRDPSGGSPQPASFPGPSVRTNPRPLQEYDNLLYLLDGPDMYTCPSLPLAFIQIHLHCGREEPLIWKIHVD